jgi:hypothetical protein
MPQEGIAPALFPSAGERQTTCKSRRSNGICTRLAHQLHVGDAEGTPTRSTSHSRIRVIFDINRRAQPLIR